MLKLPIGIQDFAELRSGGYVYADKTQQVYQLIQGKGHILFRPQRFGKSLLISTLEAIFRGRKALFDNLWIAQSDYDWQEYPTINLDFSRIYSSSREELCDSLNELLQEVAVQYDVSVESDPNNPGRTLSRLILALAKDKQVVILVDEYDRPIIDQISKPEKMNINRSVMHDFFIVIKSLSKHVRYAFVTGVSKFSKVSLFSGMNNFPDISFYPAYATLTGLTQDEIEQHYSTGITALAESMQKSTEDLMRSMRHWYNGYRFTRSDAIPTVYNPVAVHLLLDRGEFANFWFGTATPTFAINVIKAKNFSIADFDSGILISQELEESHDIEKIGLIKLLYQSGYLTIVDWDQETKKYTLSYPNEEVKQSFLQHLLESFVDIDTPEINYYFLNLRQTLIDNQLDDFFDSFNRLLQQIPYPIHVDKEAYYHSLIYLLLKVLGLDVGAESVTHRGRLDMIVIEQSRIYIFEFKLNRSAKEALQDIKEKEYAKPYEHHKKPITLIGANIDSNTRTITDWEISS